MRSPGLCPHLRISEVEKSTKGTISYTCPWGTLSCFWGSAVQFSHGQLRMGLMSPWVPVGGSGFRQRLGTLWRNAGLGDGALGLQGVLSHRSKDKASCSHWAFGFLTFLQTSFAHDLIDLGLLFPDLQTELLRHTMLAWIWLLPAGFPHGVGWERICPALVREVNRHGFEKPPSLSWSSKGPM